MDKIKLKAEREIFYEILRIQWGPVPGVDGSMKDLDAVPKIMEYYDKRLIKFYNDKNPDKNDYQNARKIYKAMLKKVDVKISGNVNNLIIKNEMEELKTFIEEKIAELSNEIRVSNLQKWIFNLYQILLISLKRRNPDEKFYFSVVTRFEKRLLNNIRAREIEHLTIEEIVRKKNPVLPNTLNSLTNPFKIIFVKDEIEWILDFLVNFEMLYKDEISKNIFLYDQSDVNQENTKIDKLKKMIDRTYNEYFLSKKLEYFTKVYGLYFDKAKGKYLYKEN